MHQKYSVVRFPNNSRKLPVPTNISSSNSAKFSNPDFLSTLKDHPKKVSMQFNKTPGVQFITNDGNS